MKDPRAVEPSPPDLGSCFVHFVHLRTQLWFATELNVSFDGLHTLALNQWPTVESDADFASQAGHDDATGAGCDPGERGTRVGLGGAFWHDRADDLEMAQARYGAGPLS